MLYQDKQSRFEKLLQKDKSVSVHMKNLQYLATEIFKVKNSLSPIIMKEVFNFQENKSHNLSSAIRLASRNMHTDTISSLGPNLWKLIPYKIKHVSLLSCTKSCTMSNCRCRLCKILVKDLGFAESCPSL